MQGCWGTWSQTALHKPPLSTPGDKGVTGLQPGGLSEPQAPGSQDRGGGSAFPPARETQGFAFTSGSVLIAA